MHVHECAHASLWHWAAWECCMANHAQLQICLCACLCVCVWVRHVIEPFEGQYPSVPTHHCWLLWFFSPLTFFFLCFKMASLLSSCSLQAEAKQEFWSTKHWEPEMATTHFVSVVIQLCSAVPPLSTSICLCLRNIGKGDLRCWKTPAALVFVALTFIAMSLGRYRCVSLLGLVFVSSLSLVRWEVFALNAVCYQNLTVSPRDKVEQWLNVSCTHFVYV